MFFASWIGAVALLLRGAQTAPPLALDHVWIVVLPGAHEREALEKAGFTISKEVNHHDGQGTASVTVEFQSSYLELIWPDPGVSVDPGLEKAAEKFRNRMMWHSTGWCPIGPGFRWTTPADVPLPVPTWTITAPWLTQGTEIEMLTPSDDTNSPSLFVSPRQLTDPAEQAGRSAQYPHAIGVTRITGVRLLSPGNYKPIRALAYLTTQTQLSLAKGDEWLLELTFDGGKQKLSKDLRPDLPLVIRY